MIEDLERLQGWGLLLFGAWILVSLFVFVVLDQLSRTTWTRRAESPDRKCTVLEGDGERHA